MGVITRRNWSLWSTALTILLLLVNLGSSQDIAGAPQAVNRINFGVVFTKVGTIMNGITSFRHMFAITTPDMTPPVLEHLPCVTTGEKLLHCEALNALVSGTNDRYASDFSDLGEELDIMYAAIGNVETRGKHEPSKQSVRRKRDVTSRRKRSASGSQPSLGPDYCRDSGIANEDSGGGFLAGLGKITSSLFGLVDNEQLKVAAKHVCELADSVDLNKRQIIASSEALSSVSAVLNNRATALQGGMQDISDRIGQVQANIVIEAAAVNDQLTNVTTRLTALERAQEFVIEIQGNVERFEHAAGEYLNRAREFVFGLNTLVGGNLPQELVTIDDVSAVLDHVVSKVIPQNNFLSLVHANPAFYYQVKSLSYTRSDNYIFITLKVPLRDVGGLLNCFRIDRTYISTSQMNAASTRIEHLPDLIAYTTNLAYFTELSLAQYVTCSGDNVRVCNTVRALQASTNPTCAAAIFVDNKVDVDRLCDISYETNDAIETHAIQLQNNRYLVHVKNAGVDVTWTLACGYSAGEGVSHIQQIASCTVCVITVPCGCSVDGGDFFIPVQLSDCVLDDTSYPSVTHLFPVNLPVLLTKFDLSDVARISGEELFTNLLPHNPLSLSDLKYNLTSADWTNVAEKDRLYRLDYKRIAAAEKSGIKTYTRDADSALRKASDYTDLVVAPFKEIYDTAIGFGSSLTLDNVKTVSSTVIVLSVLCLISGVWFTCFVKS